MPAPASAAAAAVGNSREHQSDVVLRDGSTLTLRQVRPGDRDALLAFYRGLSPQSRWFRYFGSIATDDSEVERLLRPDRGSQFVLVAETGGRITGVALYVRDEKVPDHAEIAFAVADALQGRGVGTRMLDVLAGIAREHRITIFDAYVLPDNRQMLQVFFDSGFETARRLDGGVFHVVLTLAPTAVSEARAAERSQSPPGRRISY
jgi:RimJ/RimL family protein N-acetyltransferase